ncbi:MAG: peptide/nickel transport system substrate-binding protein [Actinomycetota bacterium]|nr:peptide/nickel transport system substrate-binding protein [Actinomycetota bacterium]
MRLPLAMTILLSAVMLTSAACTGSSLDGGGAAPPAAPAPTPVTEYPRAQTLYTTGTQWSSPRTWNPLKNSEYATGTVGLVYESLFLYDAQQDKFTPWLAESGSWSGPRTYRIKVRQGVTWTDGTPLTAEDVVFTARLCRYPSVSYNRLCEWMTEVRAVGPATVDVTFSEPNHQEWDAWLITTPILPEHLWARRSEQEITSGPNIRPVGTGPYEYLAHGRDRMVWTRSDSPWWATLAYGLDPRPRYLVDVVVGSNNVALAQMLQGELDLSNNYLPGVASLVTGGYGLKTYYSRAPFMLPANTVWLIPNTTKPPLDDPRFRRALAHAIDLQKIVKNVYSDLVTPAGPTGLLSYWDEYVDKTAVDHLGFRYDPAKARRILTDAGYTDANHDGLVETRDGAPITLSLVVPDGWTDWAEAARVIASGAKAAGIMIKTETPEFDTLLDTRGSGRFDLLLNNDQQVSNTPWTYYDYMFRLPIRARQTTGNFGRYTNPRAWALVRQLDRTPTSDRATMRRVLAQLQQIQLTDLPVIPLWANGMWAQYSDEVWTGWPSAGGRHVFPTTWRGYWQLGAIRMLTDLVPAAEQLPPQLPPPPATRTTQQTATRTTSRTTPRK